jgi:gamma-glutamylcyclotransferase (GGCT)/AIG2-like uncharacterized protein YtfP
VPLFVYGTLRTGEPLNPHFLDGIDLVPAQTDPSVAQYELRVNDLNAAYPWMVRSQDSWQKSVVGEVAWISDPQVLAQVRGMEERAGYVTEWVSVQLDDLAPEIASIDALAFVFPDPQVGFLSISHGDWTKFGR